MGDVMRVKEQGGGTTRTYSVDADRAWKIAVTVFHWEGSGAIEEHRDENYMLSSSSTSGVLGDAIMGAWIQPVDEHQTSVTVVTMRVNALDLTISLTESTFHRCFEDAVKILESGKPLPLTAPMPPPNEDSSSPLKKS
jgi:hypothetical protein